MNKLYFGDNLEVLREYVPDESVDLIYLDPPFNSQAGYNVLFETPKDDADSAQAQAFRDSWTWLEDAQDSYLEIMQLGGNTARFIDALKRTIDDVARGPPERGADGATAPRLHQSTPSRGPRWPHFIDEVYNTADYTQRSAT